MVNLTISQYMLRLVCSGKATKGMAGKGDVWQLEGEERRQVMAPVLASNNKKKTD
jgi:hypothetical protein